MPANGSWRHDKVADSLSRDTDLSEATLTLILRLHVPLQLTPTSKSKYFRPKSAHGCPRYSSTFPIQLWPDILQMIADKSASSRGNKLRSTVGHLVHIYYSIPGARHCSRRLHHSGRSTSPRASPSLRRTIVPDDRSVPPFEMSDFNLASAKEWYKA